jgi:hypothetical protein
LGEGPSIVATLAIVDVDDYRIWVELEWKGEREREKKCDYGVIADLHVIAVLGKVLLTARTPGYTSARPILPEAKFNTLS